MNTRNVSGLARAADWHRCRCLTAPRAPSKRCDRAAGRRARADARMRDEDRTGPYASLMREVMAIMDFGAVPCAMASQWTCFEEIRAAQELRTRVLEQVARADVPLDAEDVAALVAARPGRFEGFYLAELPELVVEVRGVLGRLAQDGLLRRVGATDSYEAESFSVEFVASGRVMH